jgi:hypothetical protein
MFFIGIFQKGFNRITAFFAPLIFILGSASDTGDPNGWLSVILSQNLTIFVI